MGKIQRENLSGSLQFGSTPLYLENVGLCDKKLTLLQCHILNILVGVNGKCREGAAAFYSQSVHSETCWS
jgi:hypothetical protein